ncbi:MAG: MutS-related protein [Planctomycetota bacterium]
MSESARSPLAGQSASRLAEYELKVSQLSMEEAASAERWRRLGFVRGGLFLLALGGLLCWLTGQLGWGSGWLVVAGLSLLAFLAVAGIHESLAGRIFLTRLRLRINRDAVLRQQRRLRELDSVPQVLVPPQHLSLARDLDLLGDNSLYRLLGTARTPLGILLLRDWILEGADSAEITARQAAVAELRDQTEWREEFQLICEQLSVSEAGPSRFVEWCEGESWVQRRLPLLWIARLALALWLLVPLGLISGLVPPLVGGAILLATTVVSFLLSVVFAGSIHDIFNQISARQEDVRCYRRLFGQLAEYQPQAERLREIHQRLFENGALQQKLVQLGRLTWLSNLRRNGIFFLAYIFFQFMFFWDIHVLDLLERWKRRNAGGARVWFADLAQWEVLVALARLAWDHPQWAFPEVTARRDAADLIFRASQLGHPLLPPQQCVANDVEIGPPGTLLLVTGSNMSGKSTLLRSVGLNAVLAQLGAPVCAESLRMNPVELATSMRISDSLADGVSFFMAELKRLREVVSRAEALGKDAPRGQLFLLDEILQGTNSRERQIAVCRVLNRLLAAGAIGAVSTHDLELASLPELKLACRPVYFAESFATVEGKKVMTFDYRMHAGISPTTNALKLLELVVLE